MSINLDDQCLDRWLNDYDAFRVDFLRVCHPICQALGYELDFDQRQLEAAHAAWRAAHDLWKGHRVSLDTQVLSHIKVCALLMFNLCHVSWIRNLFEYNGDYHKFNGTPEQRSETAKDLNAAREVFLAFHFCTMVINWFEMYRTDKSEGFVYRVTKDLEFDMMNFLIGAEKSDMAVFLILKAAYLRD